MIRDKVKNHGPIIIDLTGPEGNAYCLMGYAKRWAKELDLDANAIITDMQSGDYEHLIKVFEENFRDYCILER